MVAGSETGLGALDEQPAQWPLPPAQEHHRRQQGVEQRRTDQATEDDHRHRVQDLLAGRVGRQQQRRQREGRQLSAETSGLKAVKYILAVSSCKGGVGKSTVAALLAKTLATRGAKTGLLDADIYGPSIPTLFNLHEPGVHTTADQKFVPNEVDGLKLMSFGFLMGDGPAVIRGPMVAQYMTQLLHGVLWGELDYLVIGDEGSPLYGAGRKGDKQLKAEKLIEEGATIIDSVIGPGAVVEAGAVVTTFAIT